MKSLARAFQSYEKGPAVKDPEFDEAEGKFKRTLKETDALMTNLQNFNKVSYALYDGICRLLTHCSFTGIQPLRLRSD
jgi:hypothetical protein